MSVINRALPTPSRRDITSLPWIDGRTVPTPLQDSTGTYVYVPRDGFKIAAVVACVGLRSGAYAQLPLKGYAEAGPAGALLNPQPELMVKPSNVVVPSVWKIQMSISRDIWGYAAGKIVGIDAAGYPSKVEWLLPDVCQARQEYVGGPLIWRVNREPVDASLILHVPSRWVTPGNPLGMSPLEHSGLVNLAKQAQDFGRNWFLRGAMPSSILYSDDEITSTQADDILNRLAARWRGRGPGVLGRGLKFEKVSVAANESQFLETMRQAASDVAISFNLPPAMIAAAVQSSTIMYTNLDQNQQQYLVQSINPDLVVVEETFGWHMKPATYASFATKKFLRSDLKTRYEAYDIGIKAGFLDPEDVRAEEELPPRTRDAFLDAKGLADAAQKLSVAAGGAVMSPDEARILLNREGAELTGPAPEPIPASLKPPLALPPGGDDVTND